MCTEEEVTAPEEEEEEEFTTNISLTSGDVDCVHLFAPGENFPCCQVCPSGTFSRTTVMTLKQGNSYTFRVGRNGQILATTSCRVIGTQDSGYNVLWSTAGELLCSGSGWVD